MYYTVYQTTNLVNGKIYIGAHQTKYPYDGYLGSGHLIRYAIKKYGKLSFIKEILFVFDNPDDMYAKERELVTEEFITNTNNYNLRLGGMGHSTTTAKQGWESMCKLMLERYGPNWHDIISAEANAKSRQAISKLLNDPIYKENLRINALLGSKQALSNESRQKRLDTYKQIGHSQGNKNSQFGTIWIHNPKTKENRKIKKLEQIPDGWNKGRTC